MYRFRGYSEALEKWVHGTGIKQTSKNTYIYANDRWAEVLPETAGKGYLLPDSGHTEVYQGDILRYTFTYAGEIYHRYYVVKEDSLEVWGEEVWRDYELDCKTFEITRLHNTKYSGTRKDLTNFNIHVPHKLIGNIWQNSDLL